MQCATPLLIVFPLGLSEVCQSWAQKRSRAISFFSMSLDCSINSSSSLSYACNQTIWVLVCSACSVLKQPAGAQKENHVHLSPVTLGSAGLGDRADEGQQLAVIIL